MVGAGSGKGEGVVEEPVSGEGENTSWICSRAVGTASLAEEGMPSKRSRDLKSMLDNCDCNP